MFGRFKAAALDRLRRVGLVLMELEAGRGGDAELEELGRELHTVKGESRMFGLQAVAEVCHACENLLEAQAGRPPTALCARLIAALDVVSASLRGDHGGEEQAAAALAEALASLLETETATSAPAVPEQGEEQSAAPEAARPAKATEDRWIQLAARQVDLVCEQVAQLSADFRALGARLLTLEGPTVATRRSFLEDFDRCRMQLDGLMSSSWGLRLQPIEPALGELVRHARELAMQQGKRVRVQISAAGAQVERSVLDELWEPLIHLVRNAVDHGIERPEERGFKDEEALLTLRAEPSGSSVILTIADDGRGIDPEAIRTAAVRRGVLTAAAAAALPDREAMELIFHHGFSTRTEVSELSGRGVGLDVVRTVVEKLGGTVSLESKPGHGTQLALSIPTRLSIERVLVIECGGALYGIPARQVLEVIERDPHAIIAVAGGEILRHREESLPYRSLAQLLAGEAATERWMLIVGIGARRWALSCPTLVGEFELLRQPLDRLLANHAHLGSSATLDDGRLVLLLSMAGVLRLTAGVTPVPRAAQPTARKRSRVLVVDDSEIIRDLVAQVLRGSGFEVTTAHNGAVALALIQESAPDAVVADVEMPVMGGFELLRRVRTGWPHLPVIMLTTRNSVEDRRQAVDLGANAHLIKSSFQEATLLETVRRFVDHVE